MAQRKPDARAADPRDTILFDLQQGRLPTSAVEERPSPQAQPSTSGPSAPAGPTQASASRAQPSSIVRHDDRRETFYDQLAGNMGARKPQWEQGGGGRTNPPAPALASLKKARVRSGSSPAKVQPSADVRHNDPRDTILGKLSGTVGSQRSKFEAGPGETQSHLRAAGKLDRGWDPNTNYELQQRDVGQLGPRGRSGSALERPRGGTAGTARTVAPRQSGAFVKEPTSSSADVRHDDRRETFYDQLAGTVDPRRQRFEAGDNPYASSSTQVGKLDRSWDPNTDYSTQQRDVGRLGASQGQSPDKGRLQSGTFVKQPQPVQVDARHNDKRETFYDQLAGTVDPRRAQWESGRDASSPAGGTAPGKLTRGWNPNTDFETTQRDVGRLDISERPGDEDNRGRGTGRPVKQSGEFVKEPQARPVDARHGDRRETYYDKLAGTLPGRVAALERQDAPTDSPNQVGRLDRAWNPGSDYDTQQRDVGRLNRPWNPSDDYDTQQRTVGRLDPSGGSSSDGGQPRGAGPTGRAVSGAFVKEGAPTRADVRHDDPRDTYYPHLGGGVHPLRDRFGNPVEGDGSSPRQVGKLNRLWDPKDDWETQQRDVGRLQIPERSADSPSGPPGRGRALDRAADSDTSSPHQVEPGRMNLPGATPVTPGVLEREGAPSRADVRHDDPRDTYYPHLGGSVHPIRDRFGKPDETDTAPREVGKLNRPWDPKDDWESKQREVGRLAIPEPRSGEGSGQPSGSGGAYSRGPPSQGQQAHERQPGKLNLPGASPVSAQPLSPRQVGKLNRPWDPKDDWETKQRDVGRLPPSEAVTSGPGGMPTGHAGAVKPWDPQSGGGDSAPRQVGKLIIPDAVSMSPVTSASPRQVGKLNRPWDPKDDWESQQRDVGKLPASSPVSSSQVHQPSEQAGKLKPWDPQNTGTVAEPRQVGKLMTPQSSPMTAVAPVSPRQVGKLNRPWDPKDDWEGQQRQVGKLPMAEPVSASPAARPSQQVGKVKPWEPQTSGSAPEPRQVGKLSVTEPVTVKPISPRQARQPGKLSIPEAVSTRAAQPLSPRSAQASSGSSHPSSTPGRTVYGSSTTTSPGNLGSPSTKVAPVVPVRGVVGVVAAHQGVPRGSGVGMSDFGRSGKPREKAPGSGGGGSGSSNQETTVHRPQQVQPHRSGGTPAKSGSAGSPAGGGGNFMPLTPVAGSGSGKSEFEPGWDYGKVRIGAKKMDLTDNLYKGEVTDFYDPTGVKDHCPKCGVKRAGRDRFCPTDGALYNQ